jgi:hypothetical protein
MKKAQIAFSISLVVASFSLIACSKENNQDYNSSKLDTLTISHSMKGWELYSWPNGNDWNYSLLEGTNRVKTYKEVTENKIVFTGIDSLRMVLDKFPAKEYIFWIGRDGYLISGTKITGIFPCLIATL